MPYFASERFYVGYGWYRKHFNVPQAWSGKRFNLEFDGVFQVAELFINDRHTGQPASGSGRNGSNGDIEYSMNIL
jgi:hypothetical protein